MIYLIDDINKDGNIIDDIEKCKIKKINQQSKLYEILRILEVE